MNPLENLRLLRDNMRELGWFIDSFMFWFNQHEYVVLVKLYGENENIPPFMMVKLEFVDCTEEREHLECPANTVRIDIGARRLREYFRIPYGENLGDILRYFTEQLGRAVPERVLENRTPRQNREIVNAANRAEGIEEDRNYCYKVRRNAVIDGRQQTRTGYNDNKTRILRPELYKVFADDETISFCYSIEEVDEKTDTEIIANWARNNVADRE